MGMTFTHNENPYLKHALENDHLLFTRWQMRLRENTKMMVGEHHRLMADAMDKVFSGEIKRLIINVPPGTTKTEMISLAGVARAFAINPRSRNMMISYSDDLVKDNSRKIRQVIQSPEYQNLWNIKLKADSNKAGLWVNEEYGQFFCASSGGQITGFRAGTMGEGFTGMLIMDDILKPEDAFSRSALRRVSRLITNTVKSRLMTERVPIVLIMQRLHRKDPCNFLLEGGTKEKWHHLWLPLEINHSTPYPATWSHGIMMKHDLPDGILWRDKFKPEDLKTLKADKYTYASQYNQNPEKAEGSIYDTSWFGRYSDLASHNLLKVIIYADTAQKWENRHDNTAFLCFGVCQSPKRFDGKKYLLLMDADVGKMNPDQMVERAKRFWERNKEKHGMNRVGAKKFRVEDKASGTGLMFELKKTSIPVSPIGRDQQSKLSRFQDAIIPTSEGRVLLPEGDVLDINKGAILTDSSFVPEFLEEMKSLDLDMTQENDDQADCFADAVRENLIDGKSSIYDNL